MVGVVLTDLIAAPFLIALHLWVVLFGALSLLCFIAGVSLTAGLAEFSIGTVTVGIPPMPYICSLFLGIAIIALALMSAVWTEICRIQVTQILMKIARWNKSLLCRMGPASPPVPLYPWITAGKRSAMRVIALTSLAVSAIALIASLGSMIITARSIEPWHVWGWFS